MLKPSDSPTRLVRPDERPPIVIVDPQPPKRSRSLLVLIRFVWLFAGVGMQFARRRLTLHDYADRVRNAFEEVGGLWLKFGQLLSLRIDVFPAELCRELARMEQRTAGFPGHMARAILESELGAPVERYFDEFDERPFATVPMGQVHRARLRRDGVWVAVKIQQPHLAAVFAHDLKTIRRLARILTLLRVRLHLRWDEQVAELEELMLQDIDFRFEASAMQRMDSLLREHGIAVPDVFSEFCTPRVLVSEFIHAALMADYMELRRSDPARLQAWLAENDIDPERVARTLFDSLYRQIFEDNLYHADLRPQNIVLLRNSKVALIDFRAVNFTEREYLQKYQLYIRALATRDYAKAADLALMLCGTLPLVDVELAKDEVIRALRSWATRTLVEDLPYHQRSIDNATAEVVSVLYGYKCTMEWFWLRIHRAMASLDDSLAVLSPRLNHTKRTLRYFRRANARAAERLVTSDLYPRVVAGIRSVMDIQERIGEFTLFQGSIIRRNARVFQAATNKVADAIAALVTMVLAIALAGSAALLLLVVGQQYPGLLARLGGPQLAALAVRFPRIDGWLYVVVLGALAYSMISLVRLRRRLRQKDVRPREPEAAL
jgi:ubiquinone biosynthesis protein